MDRSFFGLGAVFGFLGVAAGAFGAHGLEGRLAPDRLAIYETAVRYQLVHAVALLAVGLWARGQASRTVAVAGWLFVAGTIVFSGSLYGLSLSGARWLGAITPIGGVAFLGGWLLLAPAALFGR